MSDTPTTPTSAARAAAEAIRTLNHHTLAGGVAHAVDVYAVLAHLAALAGRLPQAFDQLAAFLRAEDAAGRLTVTGAEPAGAAGTGLADAVAALALATDAARGLPGPVHRAWSATARLSCVPDAEDQDGDRADDDPGTHR